MNGQDLLQQILGVLGSAVVGFIGAGGFFFLQRIYLQKDKKELEAEKSRLSEEQRWRQKRNEAIEAVMGQMGLLVHLVDQIVYRVHGSDERRDELVSEFVDVYAGLSRLLRSKSIFLPVHLRTLFEEFQLELFRCQMGFRVSSGLTLNAKRQEKLDAHEANAGFKFPRYFDGELRNQVRAVLLNTAVLIAEQPPEDVVERQRLLSEKRATPVGALSEEKTDVSEHL